MTRNSTSVQYPVLQPISPESSMGCSSPHLSESESSLKMNENKDFKKQFVSHHSMPSLTKSHDIHLFEVIEDQFNEEFCFLKEAKNLIIKSLENNLKSLNSEVSQLKDQISCKDMAIKSLTDKNEKLLLKIKDQKNEFEMYRKEMSELLKSKILENTKLEEHYKIIIEKSTKEWINLQNVNQKRQQKYEDFKKKISPKLEKCAQLVLELKEQEPRVKQLENQVIQYERQINEYSLRLTSEEESFRIQRIHKERYAKENQSLQNQIQKYKAVLENIRSNSFYCMQTTDREEVLMGSNCCECSPKELMIESEEQRVDTLRERNKAVAPEQRELTFMSPAFNEDQFGYSESQQTSTPIQDTPIRDTSQHNSNNKRLNTFQTWSPNKKKTSHLF